jgi:hypothetical protein
MLEVVACDGLEAPVREAVTVRANEGKVEGPERVATVILEG